MRLFSVDVFCYLKDNGTQKNRTTFKGCFIASLLFCSFYGATIPTYQAAAFLFCVSKELLAIISQIKGPFCPIQSWQIDKANTGFIFACLCWTLAKMNGW